MITIKEYAFATPDDLGGATGYARFCRAADAPRPPDGWGLLLGEDDAGRRITLGTADVGWVRMLALAGEVDADRPGDTPGLLDDLDLPGGKVHWRRDGWPDAWSAA